MYVERLKIENLKCYAKAHVDLNYPGKKYDTKSDPPRLSNVNLFVGENGAGKTTVCQALCIAVLKSILATSAGGFRTEGFIREGADSAEISANLTLSVTDGEAGRTEAHAVIKQVSGTEFIETRGQPAKWANALFEEESNAVFLAAYGASRRTERPEAYNERLRNQRYQRTATIFETHVGLVPIGLALGHGNRRLGEVIELANKLLPPGTVSLTNDLDFDRIGRRTIFGEPIFDADGVNVPLSGLSDGYRLHIGWIVDFLSHLIRVTPRDQSLQDAEGVVIVDEIDLLLHAEWQRHVVETLASTFKNVQFLFTTHSPIVAGTLENQNLFLIERTAPHTSRIDACVEQVFGVSIDKILVRLFGLKSPRAPELEMQLAELAEKSQQGDHDASIEYLRRLRIGAGKG